MRTFHSFNLHKNSDSSSIQVPLDTEIYPCIILIILKRGKLEYSSTKSFRKWQITVWVSALELWLTYTDNDVKCFIIWEKHTHTTAILHGLVVVERKFAHVCLASSWKHCPYVELRPQERPPAYTLTVLGLVNLNIHRQAVFLSLFLSFLHTRMYTCTQLLHNTSTP